MLTNVEIIFIGTWERLGFGRKWVEAFATCGESGECEQFILLQFQGETVLFVEELKNKTSAFKARCWDSSHWHKTSL
jgi:hypothetical protein